MKNKLFKILSLVLIASFALLFTSCGLLGGLEGLDPDVEEIKSKEEVTRALGNNYQMTIKYSSINDETGKLETTYSSQVKKDGDSILFAQSDGEIDDSNTILINDNKVFDYDKENDKYVYRQTMSTDDYEYLNSGLASVFAISSLESISYTKKEATTFLNRACTKYEYEMGMNLVGSKFNSKVTYIFDNETGICFKFDTKVEASAVGEGSEEEAGSFEVTSFKIGGVSLSKEIGKIDASTITEEPNNNGNNNTDVPEGYDVYINQGAAVLFPTDTYQKSWFGEIEKIDGGEPTLRIGISGTPFSEQREYLESEFGNNSDYELSELTVSNLDAYKVIYSDSVCYYMQIVIDTTYLNDQYWPAVNIKVQASKSKFDISVLDDSIIWEIINSFYFDSSKKYNY